MTRLAADRAVPFRERSSLLGAVTALVTLAKPGIVAAVTLTGFAAMVLAGKGLPALATAVACLASLLLMAAGSALVNSVLDRRSDRLMARLAHRSAALDRVGCRPALWCAAFLILAALAIAWTQLNPAVVLLLSAASASYGLCYTVFLKPHTHWAAVLGGLPGALPALVGSAAVGSPTDPGALALFLILLIWQPPHFWLLSLTCAEEYRAAGVPVLVLVKGEQATRNSICLTIQALIPATLLLWIAGPCSGKYAVCALLLGCSLLLACRHYLDADLNRRLIFRGSILYLLLLLSAVIVDLVLPVSLP